MSLEEMSETERQANALRLLFNHPEVGLEAKRLYKKVVPDAKFPDVEAADRSAAERVETSRQIQDLNDKIMQKDIADKRRDQHDKLKARGLSPEAVEKVMTEKNIANYETAATYLEMEQRSAPSTPASVTPISMPDDFKNIATNPKRWGREQAFKAVDEIIAQRRT